jgi:3-dehydrosphinganine reductase
VARFGPWPPAHALVTGGSSGIGLALARRLAAAGARVSLLARDPARLAAAADPLGALALPADVRDPAALAAALERAEAAQGPLDLVIASAGAVRAGRFEDLGAEAHRELIETNYLGVVETLRAALPPMRARGRGRALILGSAAGLAGLPGYSAYAPTKFALRGLAEALRAECRPDGVLVAIAHPPDVETPQLAAERAERPPETAALAGAARVLPPDAVARALLRGLAKNRSDIPVGAGAWALQRLVPAIRPLFDRWIDRTAARARRDGGGEGD